MTRRSRAREVALQLLFEHDHNNLTQRPAIERFVKGRLREQDLRKFCLKLYDGVIAHQADIDQRIIASADNWRLVRIATVDRNVLRLGAFELLQSADTPPAAAFNEAIELARRYGTANSPAFVNGVLDRLRQGIASVKEEKESNLAGQTVAPPSSGNGETAP